MAVRLTQRGIPMADSVSLSLVSGAARVHECITDYVAASLADRGYNDVSPAMLTFLGALDCGVNTGSDIARRLQVSRQMVAKTVKELCRVGYLEQIEGTGKRKQILFTASGEQLISDVRKLLAQLDKALFKSIGKPALHDANATLEAVHALVRARLDDPQG